MFAEDNSKHSYIKLLIFPVLIVVIALSIYLKKIDTDKNTIEEVVGEEAPKVMPAATLTVEISGGVKVPGIYKFTHNDARVYELISHAGGFVGDTDIEWVQLKFNLARKIVDGEKIYIPYLWQKETVLEDIANNAPKAPVEQTAQNVISDSKLDLNTASMEELDSLPGVGTVYAQKIISARPYSTVEDLVSSKAVTAKIYDQIKDLVYVR